MLENDDKVVSILGAKQEKNKKATTIKEKNHLKEDLVYCSFCNRANTEVVKMVKGPGVNICSECTMIAVQYLILEDRLPSNAAQSILDKLWGIAKD